MCLNIDIKKHNKKLLDEGYEPKLAKHAIPVYKVLEEKFPYEDKSSWHSPYQYKIYMPNTLYESDFSYEIKICYPNEHNKICYPNEHKIYYHRIEKGLHAYRSMPLLKKHFYWALSIHRVVFLMYIPKGAQYYIGRDGDIVSNKLKFPKNKIK